MIQDVPDVSRIVTARGVVSSRHPWRLRDDEFRRKHPDDAGRAAATRLRHLIFGSISRRRGMGLDRETHLLRQPFKIRQPVIVGSGLTIAGGRRTAQLRAAALLATMEPPVAIGMIFLEQLRLSANLL